MDVVDPVRIDRVWEFSPEQDGCTTDTVDDEDYLREVYVESEIDDTGRVTVPVRYDTETGSTANDESAVAQPCDLEHVKAHYYRSHRGINPTGFVPVGSQVDWTEPHDRDGSGGSLPDSLRPEQAGTSQR